MFRAGDLVVWKDSEDVITKIIKEHHGKGPFRVIGTREAPKAYHYGDQLLELTTVKGKRLDGPIHESLFKKHALRKK